MIVFTTVYGVERGGSYSGWPGMLVGSDDGVATDGGAITGAVVGEPFAPGFVGWE